MYAIAEHDHSYNYLAWNVDTTDSTNAPEKINRIQFNRALEKLTAELKATYGSKINIHLFDTYKLVNAVLANPKEYGFTNSTDSCLEVTKETTDTYKNEATMRKICHDASNRPIPESFIYFDLMHPTTHTHRLLADIVFCFIRMKYPLDLTTLDKTSLPNCAEVEKVKAPVS